MDLSTYMFGGDTRQITYKSLDAASMRSRAIAQNLAHVSTPGYRRKEVRFEDELNRIMKIKLKGTRTDEAHLEISKSAKIKQLAPKAYEPDDPTLPGEVNNVDIDLESSKMAENQILYNYSLKFAGFGKLNAAITGSPAQ